MVERGHGVRLSVSNLFKSFNSSSGFVIQVPLDLRLERWTVVVLDIVELMYRSQLFPTSYSLEGAHSLKSMTLCSNVQIRGVYTSDNEYDFVTLPSDLRFKFPFDNSNQQLTQKWPEYFDW
jgi:WD repeat-containing protein 90